MQSFWMHLINVVRCILVFLIDELSLFICVSEDENCGNEDPPPQTSIC
jgi:hypothetical protein